MNRYFVLHHIAYSNTTEKLLACDFEKTSHETEVLLFITVFKSTQPVSMFLVSFLTCFFQGRGRGKGNSNKLSQGNGFTIIADQQTSQRKYGVRWQEGFKQVSVTDLLIHKRQDLKKQKDFDAELEQQNSTCTHPKTNAADQSLICISEIAGSRHFKDYVGILLVSSNITSQKL